MRRAEFLASFTIVLILLTIAAPAAARQATPVPATGVASADQTSGFKTLAIGPLGELPPAPAFVALARFTFAPGVATGGDPDPGPALAYVEAGAITFAVDGPAFVTKGGNGAASLPEAVQSKEIRLQAGDGISIPTGTAAELRNEGTKDATLLILNLWPDDPLAGLQAPGQRGVTIEPLVRGPVEMLPPGPAAAAVVRSVYAPGQGDLAPTTSGGILLAYLESGALGYTVTEGEAAIFAAAPIATPVVAEPAATPVAAGQIATPDIAITLGAGDAVIEQVETFSSAGNAGDEPAVILIAVIGPADLITETAAP